MISHNVDGCMMMYAVMKNAIWWHICLLQHFTVRNAGTSQRSVKYEREKTYRVYDPGMGGCSL